MDQADEVDEADVDVAMSGGADQKDAALLDRNAMFSIS